MAVKSSIALPIFFPPNTHLSSPLLSAATLSHLLRHLQLSIDRRSLSLTQQTHALSFPLGLHWHPLLSTRLISAYSLLGLPSRSRLVFDGSPHEDDNALLWNSLLAAYSRNGLFREPLSLFRRMLAHAPPDNYTLAILAKVSGELADLGTGRTIHSLVARLGFSSDAVLLNSLMVMYFKCENPGDARTLFDEMPVRSAASWNVLISEYARLGGSFSGEEMWGLLAQMQMEGLKPDAFTVSTVLPLCPLNSCTRLLRGREIHCFALKNGLGLASESDFHVGSCLIDMYSKANNVMLGRRVFDRMACKNVVAWTAMISGYALNGDSAEALILLRAMQARGGTVPNKVTLLSVLLAVGSLASLMEGKQVHGFAIRAELNHEVSLNNALIDMYFKCGSLDCARHIFDDDSWHKDAITWSSMVSGYGLHGRGEEAVALFYAMRELGIKLDHITCVGVLSACGRSGLVTDGLEIYNSLVKDHHILLTVEMCSCVVDMLCRARQLHRALTFINSMPFKPSPSVWGALFASSQIQGNMEMRDLAYSFLLQLEPENPSNYVSLSNLHASSGRWDIVAEVRTRMKEKRLRKLPGCSWISISSTVHSFYVADKSHQCSDMIYAVLGKLTSTMRGAGYVPDIEFWT